MKKRIFLIVCGLVLSAALVGCANGVQASPRLQTTPEANPPSISVNGTGKVYITPDIAQVNIGVESNDANVTKALEANNESAKAIAAKLQELGVDARDIQTSSFNVYPMRNYKPDGTLDETTYTVNNSVTVTVRELTALGKILDAVVASGANTINGVNFDVVDRAKAVSEARELAVADAKVQAQEVADAAGVKITRLQNLSVYLDSGNVPYNEVKMAAAPAEVPISAGQLVITVQVSATYLISE